MGESNRITRASGDVLHELVGMFRGRCEVCGGPDARHREVDAMMERVAAGEPVESVAEDFGVSADLLRRVVNA